MAFQCKTKDSQTVYGISENIYDLFAENLWALIKDCAPNTIKEGFCPFLVGLSSFCLQSLSVIYFVTLYTTLYILQYKHSFVLPSNIFYSASLENRDRRNPTAAKPQQFILQQHVAILSVNAYDYENYLVLKVT